MTTTTRDPLPLEAPPSLARYQVVDELQMIRALVTNCWPHEAAFGDAEGLRTLAFQTLRRWTGQGLGYQVREGRRHYDPCEVFNFMKVISHSGDRVWPAAVAAGRRASRLFHRGRAAPETGTHSPARFHVEFRREFHLGRRCPGALARLRVPVPFEDRTQYDIQIAVTDPADAHVDAAPGRIEVRAEPAGDGTAAVEVHVSLTASCEVVAVDPSRLVAPDLSDPDVQLYTRPTEGLIRVTPAIAALAESLAGTARDPWQALRRFWRFFFEHMQFGVIHPDQLGASDPLGDLVQGGWCDCVTGSALLVALCRARGIPARVVGGLCLEPDSPAIHYWAEVFLPPYGWFPLDLMSWDLAAGGSATEWRDHYFGRMDHRMKTECLPRIFVGPVGVRRPPAWYVLVTRETDTTQVEHYALPNVLLYRDRFRVTELEPGTSWKQARAHL